MPVEGLAETDLYRDTQYFGITLRPFGLSGNKFWSGMMGRDCGVSAQEGP